MRDSPIPRWSPERTKRCPNDAEYERIEPPRPSPYLTKQKTNPPIVFFFFVFFVVFCCFFVVVFLRQFHSSPSKKEMKWDQTRRESLIHIETGRKDRWKNTGERSGDRRENNESTDRLSRSERSRTDDVIFTGFGHESETERLHHSSHYTSGHEEGRNVKHQKACVYVWGRLERTEQNNG